MLLHKTITFIFNQTVLLLLICFAYAVTGCAQAEMSGECPEQKKLQKVETKYTIPMDTDNFDSKNYASLCGSNLPLFENRFSPYLGGTKSVDIVVEYFANFRCIHCANFAAYSKSIWKNNKEINNRVRIYFHHLPYNDDVQFDAATIAAKNQGMSNFWKMHDYAFKNIGANLTYQNLYDYAYETLKLDMTQFEENTTQKTNSGKATYDFIQREHDQAVNACLKYTPSIYVCGRYIEDWRKLEETLTTILDKQ